MQVCPVCGKHYRISAWQRIETTVDTNSFSETHKGLTTLDPLAFSAGGESYLERVARAQKDSKLEEALLTGAAKICGTPVVMGVMEAEFIMGSMGSVVGEKFCRMVNDAIEYSMPLIVFTASGGARMQEGILALMQMAKTADAVKRINDAGIPYISVLTDPTTGGVWASFASLGDIIIAEPGAYIGFAGKRLIMGALKVKLPEGFQSTEYQFQNGYIDAIVKRQEMRGISGAACQISDPSPIAIR
jgi:acetyl-CoA carboxylase carboxyl transferase subunit beta